MSLIVKAASTLYAQQNNTANPFGTQQLTIGSSANATGTWMHFALAGNGNATRFYVNGLPSSSQTTFQVSIC